MYDLIARPLSFFYSIWPSYAGAITLLTLTIMLVLLPADPQGHPVHAGHAAAAA